MNIEVLIIIIVISIFLAILFFLYRLLYQKKKFKNGENSTTEIENVEISVESPLEKEKEKINYGNMDILIKNKKISTVKMMDQEIRIGRDPIKSTVIISEPTVSKLHCTLYLKKNRIIIRDNDSTNGIYINNKRISEQEINNNDVISLGKKGIIQIIFRLNDIPEIDNN